MSTPRIVPTLNSFWLAPKSFIVFQAIAFDEPKQTETAAFQHMLDNGTMGFDSITGVNA